jgi:hypothetical protein
MGKGRSMGVGGKRGEKRSKKREAEAEARSGSTMIRKREKRGGWLDDVRNAKDINFSNFSFVTHFISII